MIRTVIINDMILENVDEIRITSNGLTVEKKLRDKDGNIVKSEETGYDVIDKTWIELNEHTKDIMFIGTKDASVIRRIVD